MDDLALEKQASTASLDSVGSFTSQNCFGGTYILYLQGEDEGSMLLRSIYNHLQKDMVSQPGR
jgi:hypothetical protein